MAYTFQVVMDAQVLGALEAAKTFLNHMSRDFELPKREFIEAGRTSFRRLTAVTVTDIAEGNQAVNTTNNTTVVLTVKNKKGAHSVKPSQIFSPDSTAQNLQRLGEKVADGFGLQATKDVIDDLVGLTITGDFTATLTAGQSEFFADSDSEQRDNLTKIGGVIAKIQANSGMDLGRMWILLTTKAFGNLMSYSQNTLGTTIQWIGGIPFWQGMIPIFGNDNAGDTAEWGPVNKACAFVGAGDGYFFDWGAGDIVNGGWHGYGDGMDKLIFRRVSAFGVGDQKLVGTILNGAS